MEREVLVRVGGGWMFVYVYILYYIQYNTAKILVTVDKTISGTRLDILAPLDIHSMSSGRGIHRHTQYV